MVVSLTKTTLVVAVVAVAVSRGGAAFPSDADATASITAVLPTSSVLQFTSHITPWPAATSHVQGGTSTSASVTNSPTRQAQPACNDSVTQCLADANCSQCLAAVGRAVADVLDDVPSEDSHLDASRVAPRVASGFTRALVNTEACAAAPPDTLGAALDAALTSPCDQTAGFPLRTPTSLTACVTQSVFQCYLAGAQCTGCVLARASANNTKASSFQLPECSHASMPLFNVVKNCVLGPCTAIKTWCESSRECAGCLATLNSGKPASAARQCPFRGADETPQMADLVSTYV